LYLIDTNVLSEARKGPEANPGVSLFFRQIEIQGVAAYISAVTVGELRRGVDLLRHRGDQAQAHRLEAWLEIVLKDFSGQILPFGTDAALVWGRLRVPDPAHALDKQIAATALVNDLVVVTRNTADFESTGVKFMNPFES